MIRAAFTMNDGAAGWTGGYNFLRNAFRILRSCGSRRVSPVLFVGPDMDPAGAAELARELDEPPEPAPWLGPEVRSRRRTRALVTGHDAVAADAFRRRSIDVVFEAGEYFGARFPLPSLTWVADFQSHHLPDMFSARDRWRTYLGRHLQLLGRRTLLLSSEDARRDCLRFYPGSAGRIIVAPFAVLPDATPLPDPEVLGRYGLPSRYFFLPNQLWKHKNHLLVLRALQRVRRQRPDVVVVACGNPIDHRHPGHAGVLDATARALGLTSEYRFLGLIPRPDLAALMELSAGVINPSLFEGWSTTVEEAKSLGVPLILSALAVHREQAGTAARYFDPRSEESAAGAIVEAWNQPSQSPAERRTLAAPGVQRRTRLYATRLEGAFLAAARRINSS